MVRFCCVESCGKADTISKKISFHEFPPDPELCRKWLEAISAKDLDPYSFGVRVCGRHFSKNDYVLTKGKGKHLKPDAVPSVVNRVLSRKPQGTWKAKRKTSETASRRSTRSASKMLSFSTRAEIPASMLPSVLMRKAEVPTDSRLVLPVDVRTQQRGTESGDYADNFSVDDAVLNKQQEPQLAKTKNTDLPSQVENAAGPTILRLSISETEVSPVEQESDFHSRSNEANDSTRKEVPEKVLIDKETQVMIGNISSSPPANCHRVSAAAEEECSHRLDSQNLVISSECSRIVREEPCRTVLSDDENEIKDVFLLPSSENCESEFSEMRGTKRKREWGTSQSTVVIANTYSVTASAPEHRHDNFLESSIEIEPSNCGNMEMSSSCIPEDIETSATNGDKENETASMSSVFNSEVHAIIPYMTKQHSDDHVEISDANDSANMEISSFGISEDIETLTISREKENETASVSSVLNSEAYAIPYLIKQNDEPRLKIAKLSCSANMEISSFGISEDVETSAMEEKENETASVSSVLNSEAYGVSCSLESNEHDIKTSIETLELRESNSDNVCNETRTTVPTSTNYPEKLPTVNGKKGNQEIAPVILLLDKDKHCVSSLALPKKNSPLKSTQKLPDSYDSKGTVNEETSSTDSGNCSTDSLESCSKRRKTSMSVVPTVGAETCGRTSSVGRNIAQFVEDCMQILQSNQSNDSDVEDTRYPSSTNSQSHLSQINTENGEKRPVIIIVSNDTCISSLLQRNDGRHVKNSLPTSEPCVPNKTVEAVPVSSPPLATHITESSTVTRTGDNAEVASTTSSQLNRESPISTPVQQDNRLDSQNGIQVLETNKSKGIVHKETVTCISENSEVEHSQRNRVAESAINPSPFSNLNSHSHRVTSSPLERRDLINNLDSELIHSKRTTDKEKRHHPSSHEKLPVNRDIVPYFGAENLHAESRHNGEQQNANRSVLLASRFVEDHEVVLPGSSAAHISQISVSNQSNSKKRSESVVRVGSQEPNAPDVIPVCIVENLQVEVRRTAATEQNTNSSLVVRSSFSESQAVVFSLSESRGAQINEVPVSNRLDKEKTPDSAMSAENQVTVKRELIDSADAENSQREQNVAPRSSESDAKQPTNIMRELSALNRFSNMPNEEARSAPQNSHQLKAEEVTIPPENELNRKEFVCRCIENGDYDAAKGSTVAELEFYLKCLQEMVTAKQDKLAKVEKESKLQDTIRKYTPVLEEICKHSLEKKEVVARYILTELDAYKQQHMKKDKATQG